MKRLWKSVARKLFEKDGAAGLIWGAALLFTAAVFILGAALIIGTYTAGLAAKADLTNAAKNALTQEMDADYAQMRTGFSDPSAITSQLQADMLVCLQNEGYTVNGGNAAKKDSNGNIIYEIDEIQVSSVQNDGDVSGARTALKITFTYTRPIRFAALMIPISANGTVYVYRNPTDF